MRKWSARAMLLALACAAVGLTGAMPTSAADQPDAALVEACCWAVRAVAGWLALSIVVATACACRRTPSLVLRLSGIAPDALHAAVRAAGVGGATAAVLAVAVPAAAVAGPPGPGTHRPTPTGRLDTGSLSLDWPIAESVRPPEVAPPPRRVRTVTGTPASAPAHDRTLPHQPGSPSTRAGAGAAPGRRVEVHSGDTLWSIAASRLPAGAGDARIQRSWHRWWVANRRVIGPDPDLIRPGQRLAAPRVGSPQAATGRQS